MTSARQKLATPIDVPTHQVHGVPTDLDHVNIRIYGSVNTTDAAGDTVSRAVKTDISDVVTGIDLDLSMEVASTITITLRDPRGTYLNSGVLFDPDTPLLDHHLWAKIDGLPDTRVAKVNRAAGGLTLVCEDKNIGLLRRNKYPKTVAAGVMTAQEFIAHLVAEEGIGIYCPDLDILLPTTDAAQSAGDAQTAQAIADRAPGFPAGVKLKVKTDNADSAQLANMATIIATGLTAGVRKKVIVAAIMTCIQEATARNLPGGDSSSVGLFQQLDKGWGTYEDRHTPAIAAANFYRACRAEDQQHPNESLWELCANTQRPKAEYRHRYDDWKDQAFAIVSAYTGSAGDANAINTGPGYSAAPLKGKDAKAGWSRGLPHGPLGESSWDCIQRMTQDLKYHCWSSIFSGVVFLMSDRDTIAMKPRITFSEDLESVEFIDFDCDTGKLTETAKVTGNFELTTAPAGSVVIVERSGPANGRWLVNDFRRSLYSVSGEIELKRATPGIGDIADPNAQTALAAASPVHSNTPTATGDAATRNAIVAATKKAHAAGRYNYVQSRPMPDGLFTAAAKSKLDCSSFAVLSYKAGGAKDPNGTSYNGSGNTFSLVARGTKANKPKLADLCMYSGSEGAHQHTTVYIGGGKCIGMGLHGVGEYDAEKFPGLTFEGYWTFEV